MKAGRFRHRITFQKPGVTKDPRLGTAVKGGWANYAENIPAEVQDILPSRSERVDQTINIARRPARIRLRRRSDITPDMRIIFGTRVLHIVAGPADLDRIDMELMAEEYTSGEATA